MFLISLFLKNKFISILGRLNIVERKARLVLHGKKEKVSDEVIDKALVLADQSIKQFDAVLVLEAEHARAKK